MYCKLFKLLFSLPITLVNNLLYLTRCFVEEVVLSTGSLNWIDERAILIGEPNDFWNIIFSLIRASGECIDDPLVHCFVKDFLFSILVANFHR